ncbi:MAG: ABC transporter permease [Acidobacteriota bacterium]|nr:ABC transporter permease [Acidobacteriota bacterium]
MLLIAVPVTLILTLIGLANGYTEESRKRQAGVGADIRMTAPGANALSFSAASIPEKLVAVVAAEPHVREAVGTVIQPIQGWDFAVGIDPVTFDRMSGGFIFDSGRTFQGPDDILVDTWYAEQRHVQVGSTLNLWNHNWRVVGIVEPGKLGHIFVQKKPLQEYEGIGEKVSQIYIKVDNPANTGSLVEYLKNKYDRYGVLSMAELASLISVDNVPYLKPFLNVIIGIGVVIAFFVVSLSMYMAVLQRTREIGILKSLGAENKFVMGLILSEAFFMGLGGTIIGILLSYGTQYAIHAVMPASLPQAIVYSWWPRAGAVAMGAALLGALYPGMMAVRQDPIEALAYE